MGRSLRTFKAKSETTWHQRRKGVGLATMVIVMLSREVWRPYDDLDAVLRELELRRRERHGWRDGCSQLGLREV